MTQNSFILYTNYRPIVELFTMEERGMLWTAIFDHVVGEEKILLPDNVKIAFEFIKNQLNVDLAKYERIVERNREIASTRKTKEKKQSLVVNEHHWSPVVTSGKSGTPNDNENNNDNKNKNKNDNENVNDNVNENVNVNVNENENVNECDQNGSKKGLASLGEILSASPFSSPVDMTMKKININAGDTCQNLLTGPLQGMTRDEIPSQEKASTPPWGHPPDSTSHSCAPAPPDEHLPERPISVLPPKTPPNPPPYEPLPSDWMLPERLNNLCLKFLNQSKVTEAKNAYIRECNRRGFRAANSETGFVSYLKRYLFETTTPLTDTNIRSVENLIDTLKKEVYSWT